MADKDNHLVVIGRISSPYGIKGWVKIYSSTDPVDNILHYQPWYLRQNNTWREVKISEGRSHGKAMVVHIEAVNDRTSAEQLKGCEIAIRREQLPESQPGEYYWIDLIGMRVINQQGIELGVVDHILETGANDVLVLSGDKERLIPFVMEEFVKQVDLDNREIHVDWDVDF